MIRRASPEARTALQQYLDEVTDALEGTSLDAEEILRDIEDHVEEALEGTHAVGEREMMDVLERLGPPTRWAPADRRAEPTDQVPGWAKDRIPAIAVVAGIVTAVALATFPWFGPLPLLGAWVVSRGGLEIVRRVDSDLGVWDWMLYPAPILVSFGLTALVLFGPAGPLSELVGSHGPERALARTAAGLGVWWIVVGMGVAAMTGPVRWLLDPIAVRRRHGHVVALVGVVTAATGGLIALVLGAS